LARRTKIMGVSSASCRAGNRCYAKDGQREKDLRVSVVIPALAPIFSTIVSAFVLPRPSPPAEQEPAQTMELLRA
jgi:hypothetical protein